MVVAPSRKLKRGPDLCLHFSHNLYSAAAPESERRKALQADIACISDALYLAPSVVVSAKERIWVSAPLERRPLFVASCRKENCAKKHHIEYLFHKILFYSHYFLFFSRLKSLKSKTSVEISPNQPDLAFTAH